MAGALGHVVVKETARLAENAHQKPLNLARSHKKTRTRILWMQRKFPLKSPFRWHSTSEVYDTFSQGHLPEYRLVSLLPRDLLATSSPRGSPSSAVPSVTPWLISSLSGLPHPCLSLYFTFFNCLMDRILHNKAESENLLPTNQKPRIQ